MDGVAGAAFRERLAFGPTCNIAGIDSGYSGPGMKTIVPARASAWLDFRLVSDQDSATILALLRSHLEADGFADVAVTALGMAEPAGTALNHELVRTVAAVAGAVSGKPASITARFRCDLAGSSTRSSATSACRASRHPTTRLYFGANLQYRSRTRHVKLEDIGHAVRFTYALFDALGD